MQVYPCMTECSLVSQEPGEFRGCLSSPVLNLELLERKITTRRIFHATTLSSLVSTGLFGLKDERCTDNITVKSRKLVPTYSLKVSQSRADQMMSILKLPHGYPWCSLPLLLIPFVCGR